MSDKKDNSERQQPSLVAFQAREAPDGHSYFNRVGAAFAHKDGNGHTLQLDSLPVDGRVILRTPQERVAEARSKETRTSRREETER